MRMPLGSLLAIEYLLLAPPQDSKAASDVLDARLAAAGITSTPDFRGMVTLLSVQEASVYFHLPTL